MAGAPEIQPSRVLRYMGTDIYLQGTPIAPRNLPEVRAAGWKQHRPQQLSPGAAMMVLMVNLPGKLLPPSQRLPPHGPGARGERRADGAGVQPHDGNLPPCPHRCTLGTLGAWPLGFDPVLTLVASRGRPRMGPARCLGQRGLSRVPDLYPPGPPSDEGGALPCSPQGNTPTIHGAPTSSLRCSGWWMRCPCPCGCRARARGQPHPGAGPWRTTSGGNGGPCPPGGGVPHPVW